MDKTYTGLQKAIEAIGKTREKATFMGADGRDAVDHLAGLAQVARKTVLNWLREDGTPIGSTRPMPDNQVTAAATKAGGVPNLARELGVTPQAVREWIKLGYVPVQRAQQIEITYGIPRADLVSPKVRSAMGLGGDL